MDLAINQDLPDIPTILKLLNGEIIYHEKIMAMSKQAKVIIRTGNYSPWGNVVLVSGVKAHVWFAKPDVIVPDFYLDRVNYVDNDFPEK